MHDVFMVLVTNHIQYIKFFFFFFTDDYIRVCRKPLEYFTNLDVQKWDLKIVQSRVNNNLFMWGSFIIVCTTVTVNQYVYISFYAGYDFVYVIVL